MQGTEVRRTDCYCGGGDRHEHRPSGGGGRILSCPPERVESGSERGIRLEAEGVLNAYGLGWIQGVETYAWMKDGVTYVGTTGRTLSTAIHEFLNEQGYPGAPGA